MRRNLERAITTDRPTAPPAIDRLPGYTSAGLRSPQVHPAAADYDVKIAGTEPTTSPAPAGATGTAAPTDLP